MQREDHLQCSAKNRPWGGSGKQSDMEQWQGSRRSVGLSSLAWVSLSLIPCYRQGSCRDRIRLAVPSTIGAAMLHTL